MSTIKSSTEHLTLNADGSGKDIKFQANGVEKASISSAGAFTSTSIDATKLSGTVPNFTSTGIDDNATSTAITIDGSENVGIGVVPESWFGNQTALQIGGTGAALSADIGAAYYSNNAYRDSSGNWKRVGSGYATRNMLYNGAYYFDVAGTSTADSAITWTTAMSINNDGSNLMTAPTGTTPVSATVSFVLVALSSIPVEVKFGTVPDNLVASIEVLVKAPVLLILAFSTPLA